MSIRGNCWNNTPQESFFGHLKDETYIKDCETLEELQEEIEDIARKVEKAGAYLNPKCSWKKNDNLTEKQVQACKGKKVKTIWDVLVYFSKRNSYFSLKYVI